ncbi:unnamed protein product [Malus baccata var. baccata]
MEVDVDGTLSYPKPSNGSHIFQEVLSTVVGDATSSKNYNTLEFDLIVYAPYLSIEGFVNDIEGQQRRKLIKSCSQMHHSLSLLGRYEYDLSVKLLAVQAQNFVVNHETYPLNLMQQVCRVADFERLSFEL